MLSDAITEFQELDDNYAYQYECHQTNGEDWFAYQLVKLDAGNMYLQRDVYHSNTGWENEDLILTYYDDLTDIPYEIYDIHDNGSARHYYKFKYNDSDTEFQRLYMDVEKEEVPQKFDYHCFKVDMFENTYDAQTEVITNEWRMTNDYLNDEAFKEKLIESFDLGGDAQDIRVDYVYLYVNDSIITQLKFGYWGGYNNQNMFHITIDFDRDLYTFDWSALTTGFVDYETVMDN